MAMDPRNQQRRDAERIPDEKPRPQDPDSEQFEPVELDDDDLETENDDVDDDDLDEDLEEV
jgi:hypothetical protein